MLLVFSDDWGRHPSSCQHLVRHLLPRHAVTWVNTIGMRPPTLDWSTVRRAGEKLRSWGSRRNNHGGGGVAENPVVLSPKMWPWFRRGHDRWLNRKLLERQLKPKIEAAEEPVYAVTTIPIVADVMDSLNVARWTYYCVDDFSAWPGLDQQTMEIMEREVIARCDAVVAVSETLVSRVAERGKAASLLPHGVDLSFWSHTGEGGLAIEAIQGLESPLIVFWGVIDTRMNLEWIRRLSSDLTCGTILLVGPVDAPDPTLLSLPRVVHRPSMPLEQLPTLGARADVLIMPYADLAVTRAMQPLKLKEYMATGKPVVASRLPATQQWSDCIDVTATAEEFSAAVRQRLTAGVAASQLAARKRLESESWAQKALAFEAIVMNSPVAAAETKVA